MRDRRFYRDDYKDISDHRHKSRVFFGLAVAVAGIVLLLRTMGVLPHFSLEFSWPVLLIILGLFVGIKRGFRNNAWWIMILVGVANLTPEFTIMGKPSSHFIWPAMIIIAGLAIALRPKRERCAPAHPMTSNINTESTLQLDISFGGRKEVITSKDFKGGVISVAFGGCEINLTQADFTTPFVIIDCRVSFGSIEIIVPSHWEVINEISHSFGSVEDERTLQTGTTLEGRKTLILRGGCSFGSVEIKSY